MPAHSIDAGLAMREDRRDACGSRPAKDPATRRDGRTNGARRIFDLTPQFRSHFFKVWPQMGYEILV
jgi:hypothetical protein